METDEIIAQVMRDTAFYGDDGGITLSGGSCRSLKNAVRVDLLPCHSLGCAKSEALGVEGMSLREYEPSADEIEYAQSILGL